MYNRIRCKIDPSDRWFSREEYLTMDYKRVLIIDDSEIDRSILKNILDTDYYVMEAENGFKGIEILLNRKNKIDCVLLDLHMPILDGFRVLELMKENGLSDIPVIIITSESTEQNLMKTVSYDIRDFICKPFDKNLVRSRLKMFFTYGIGMNMHYFLK